MAIHRKRSVISTIFAMLSLDPLPLPVLVLVTAALILPLAQWFFSFHFSVKTPKANAHLALLAALLVLVFLVRWLSPTEVSPPGSDGCCQRFTGCSSEGFLPFMVAGLIVGLVVMGQYQNQIHGKWFRGFG